MLRAFIYAFYIPIYFQILYIILMAFDRAIHKDKFTEQTHTL